MQTPQLLAMVPINPHFFFKVCALASSLTCFHCNSVLFQAQQYKHRIFDGFTFNMDACLIPRRKMMVVPRHDYFFHSRIIAPIWHCMPQRLDRRREKNSLRQRWVWIYFRVNSSIVSPDFQSKMPWGNMMAMKLIACRQARGRWRTHVHMVQFVWTPTGAVWNEEFWQSAGTNVAKLTRWLWLVLKLNFKTQQVWLQVPSN